MMEMQMDSQSNQNQSKQDRSRTKWTTDLNKLFVELVLEQVLQGNGINNVFNKLAWKHIRDEFNKQTGLEFNRKQLKKHLDVLRNRYDNAKSQFDQSGLAGDESKDMLIARDEVWEDYIEVYPLGETTRIKDCPFYDQLCQIFSESDGIGRYAQSSHYIEPVPTSRPSPFPKVATVSVDPAIPCANVHDDSSSPSGADVNLDTEHSHKPSTPNSHTLKRKHNRFNHTIAEAMLEMATASRLRAHAMIQRADEFCITKCVRLLDEMPEVDDSLYYKALDMFDNTNLREIFVSLKRDIRLKWLKSKCNSLL